MEMFGPHADQHLSLDQLSISRNTSLAPQAQEKIVKPISAKCSSRFHSVPLYYCEFGHHLAPEDKKLLQTMVPLPSKAENC